MFFNGRLRWSIIRGNVKTDPEWAKTLQPGWQEERMNNFEDCLFNPIGTSEDLVADGWTDIARSIVQFRGRQRQF